MTQHEPLLAAYTQQGSEDAFRELVARYTDLVHSTAFRLAGGDAHRAKDICQMVFIDLARKAPSLPAGVQLGGWLHRHTCFVASNLRRSDRRRQAREDAVAAELLAMPDHTDANLEVLRPVLDDAIDSLPDEDRTAILLRFFDQQDLRSVGESLGTTENAARMRVSRALDRLHAALGTRGVRFPAASLPGTLAAHAVTSAPAGLPPVLAQAALAAKAAALATTASASSVPWTVGAKVAAGALALVLLGGLGVTAIHQQIALRHSRAIQARLQSELESLEAQLAAEVQGQPTAGAQGQLTQAERLELVRLRREVSELRRQVVATSRAATPTVPPGTSPGSATTKPRVAPRPFHVHLVRENADETSAEMTGTETGSDGRSFQTTYPVDSEPLLGADSVQSVNAVVDPLTGKPQIEIRLTESGAKQFAQVTREHLDRKLALAIDGQVYAAPIIRSEIAGGQLVISGSFTEGQARELAARLEAAVAGK